MAGTFTLTGKFVQSDGVTPRAGSSLTISTVPYPDTADDAVYSGTKTVTTDVNGQISVSLVTETGLYYRLLSGDDLITPNPLTFLAPSAGSTVNVADLVVFDAAGVTPTVADQAAASAASAAASASMAATAPAKGLIAFVWDDGYASHDTVASLASARAQKHTFAVVSSFMSGVNPTYARSARVAAWSAAGHEIASHSVDHSNLSGLTAAQRAAQYDDSRTALEAVIGAGKVNSFVYPFGGSARNATMDKEVYLRYDRAVDTGPWFPYRVDDGQRPGDFLVKRFSWKETDVNNQELLSWIRKCATEPIILITTGHNLGDPGSPTQAQATAAMDLAQSLGVPCVPLSVAMPASSRLVNAGFEDFSGTDPVGWGANVSSGAQIIESIADAPVVGLPGSRSLHIKTNGDTAFAYARQPVFLLASTRYQVTGRYRATITGAGTGGCYIRVQEYGYDSTAAAITTDQTAALTATGSWSTFTLTIDTNNAARWGYLDVLVNNQTAEFWVDHIDIRPLRYGAFG